MGKIIRPQQDIIVPKYFTPLSYQQIVLEKLCGIQGKPETRKKRVLMRWHRRAGKDVMCLAYMFSEMVRQKGIYYYVFPSYAQGKKAIWESDWVDGKGNHIKMLDMMPKDLIKRLNNQEMVMELHNGSVMRILGTEKADTLRGVNPQGIVFSEYAEQDPYGWDVLRPVVALNRTAWVIFNGTPKGRNHMYELECNVRHLDTWYVDVKQTLWPESENYTGRVSQETLDDERAAGSEEDHIEQEYGVSYAAGVKGAYYAECIQKAYQTDRIGEFPPDDSKWVSTYWDLGKNDDTAIWFVQRDGTKVIFVDYHEENGKNLAHYAQVLADKGYRYRGHFLPWDGRATNIQTNLTNEEMLRDCLRQAGVNDHITVVPRSSVQEGIAAARLRFSRYYFNAGLVMDGIKKLELYHKRFDTKRRVFMNEPFHDWTSHCADALRCEAMAADLDGQGDPLTRELEIVAIKSPFNLDF